MREREKEGMIMKDGNMVGKTKKKKMRSCSVQCCRNSSAHRALRWNKEVTKVMKSTKMQTLGGNLGIFGLKTPLHALCIR